MRHFLTLAGAPLVLAGGVSTGSAIRSLVVRRGTLQRFVPTDRCAPSSAVHIAPVALAADVYLQAAALAVVQPRRMVRGPHARSSWHWTTPGIAGIKARRERSPRSRSAEGPGFSPKEFARAFACAAYPTSIAKTTRRARKSPICHPHRLWPHVLALATGYALRDSEHVQRCADPKVNAQNDTRKKTPQAA